MCIRDRSELGVSEKQYHCRTHLGHLLHDGDTAWGFDFTRANLNNPNIEKMKPSDIPDVVSCYIQTDIEQLSHTHTHKTHNTVSCQEKLR